MQSGRASTSNDPQLVGLDLTPLGSGHGIRGIGRYVAGIVSALAHERPEWMADHLGALIRPGTSLTGTFRTWRSRRPTFRPQDLEWLWAVWADRLAIHDRPPAIWHQTDPNAPFGPLPASRSVVTVYDLIPLREPDVMARIRPHRRLIYRLYLRQVRRAAFVVAISQSTAAEVERTLRVPRSRIRVVYPAVLPVSLRPIAPPADPSGPAEFLFVGVPDPHKRPDLAVAALATYRRECGEARLTFVGQHPAAARASLAAQAQDSGVGPSVRFLDRVSDDELAGLYARAVLLTLSRVEGFGLPPVEALLSGGRVVATPAPIYDEVLSGLATFARDGSPASVAQAMAACRLGDPPEPAAIAQLADRFSPRRAADTLVAVYEEALASAARQVAEP